MSGNRMRALTILFVLSVLFWVMWRALPPEWRPSAPLDVAAPTTPVTWIKLRALTADNRLCQTALATAPFPTSPVPDQPPHGPASLGRLGLGKLGLGKLGLGRLGLGELGACSLTHAVRVASGLLRLSPGSFLASCPLAVDWAMFVTHVLQPAALATFNRPTAQVVHLGSYDCRNIAGTDQQSAHATANALDVAAFQIAGGPTVPVSAWNQPGPPGRFLHQLRNGACRYFGIVLSPDFNAAHAGHFHLQATGFGFCS